MKRLFLIAGLLAALSLSSVAIAGEQCDLAWEFGGRSPAQNTACFYEWFMELLGGWA